MTDLQLGALVPHRELGRDPGAVKAFAQGVEAAGFRHVLAYEHVLGASTRNRPDWTGPYNEADPFHEPFVLYAFMAAVTVRLGFVTGIMVLPQRQTALVAKQAAELSILSAGRFRLGVGIGWNDVEFEALAVPWEHRGARFEEQLVLLRHLWTDPVVDFTGRFHRVDDAGINPLPPEPVPLWLGTGRDPRALDRVARLADGWVPSFRQADGVVADTLDALRVACDRAGRPFEALGIEARLILGGLSPERWSSTIDEWREAGATHLSVSTNGLGFETVDQHLRFLERFAADHSSPSEGSS